MTNFSILQLNANGLGANGSELKTLLQNKLITPDVVLIQETKISKKRKFNVPGYNTIRVDREKTIQGKNPAGGLITLIKKDIDYNRVNITIPGIEIIGTDINIYPNKTTTILNVYFSPSISISKESLKELSNYITDSTFIGGDFNAHNSIWSNKNYTCQRGKIIEQWIDDNQLLVLNDGEPTRHCLARNIYSAIDLSLITKDLVNDAHFYIHDDSWGSDHFPIFTTFASNINSQTESNKPIKPAWNFDKANWNQFRNICSQRITNNIITGDIELFNTRLTDNIIHAASKSIPLKKISQHIPVPWWNDEIMQARKERKKLRKKAKKDSNYISHAVKARNNVKNLIHKARTTAWKKFCSTIDIKTNSKQVWKKINGFRGKSGGTNIPSINNSKSKEEKAQLLARQFAKSSSDSNYSDDFQNRIKNTKDYQNQPNLTQYWYNQPFTITELNKVINNKKGTATGLDSTSYTMFKNLPNDVKQILLDLYNKIWKAGKIPTEWKESLIIPLHKAGKDVNKAESYRPVSLTSNLCKTLEGMVNNRLTHYLETNNKITPNQCGYRNSYNTTDHLVRLQHHIRMAQHQKKYTVAVFLDFSKAFDMVWKNGLMQKIDKVGIKGAMANYINDFMSDRSFRLKCDNTISDNYTLDNGTPQGSIISPTLFNIMVNDLFDDVPKEVNTSQFADDGALWLTHHSLDEATKTMQLALNKVSQWTQDWGFQLSTSKTVTMVFKRAYQKCEKVSLYINNEKLNQVKQTKFLGVIFDQNLNWSEHINELVHRCKGDLNIIKKLSHTRWGSNKEMLLIIYKSLIRSKLEYGAEAWSDASKYQLKKLKSIQYQACKCITGALSGTPGDYLINELGELPLDLQWKKQITNYIARSMHKSIITDLHQHYLKFFRKVKGSINKNKVPSPFGHTMDQINKELGLKEIEILSNPYNDHTLIPPDIPEISTDEYLSKRINKQDPSPTHLTTTQHYLDTKYKSHIKIYTDGSKNDMGEVGIGIHSPVINTEDQTISYNLPEKVSIFTAELTAVLIALKLINSMKYQNYAILTDSLSALQALKNHSDKNRNDLIHQIYKEVNIIKANNNLVTIVWVPSHIGLTGNEKADKAAKLGLGHEDKIDLSYSKKEIKSLVKDLYNDKYNQEWKKYEGISSYYAIQPRRVNKIHNYHPFRKVDVVITRLRFNKVVNNEYLNMIKKSNDNLCKHCKSRDTIDHIIFHCKQYQDHTKKLVDKTQATNIQQLLSNSENYNHLATFLLKTQLYKVL